MSMIARRVEQSYISELVETPGVVLADVVVGEVV